MLCELKCHICEQIYQHVDDLVLHLESEHIEPTKQTKTFACDNCSQKYTSKFNLKRHKTTCLRKCRRTVSNNTNRTKNCKFCSKTFTRNTNLKLHVRVCYKKKYGKELEEYDLPDYRYRRLRKDNAKSA